MKKLFFIMRDDETRKNDCEKPSLMLNTTNLEKNCKKNRKNSGFLYADFLYDYFNEQVNRGGLSAATEQAYGLNLSDIATWQASVMFYSERMDTTKPPFPITMDFYLIQIE